MMLLLFLVQIHDSYHTLLWPTTHNLIVFISHMLVMFLK